MDTVRPLGDKLSNRLEAVAALVRVPFFDDELSRAICNGGAERGVQAMRLELLPEPQRIVSATGKGDTYRNAGGLSLPSDHVLVPFNYAPTPPMTDLKWVFKGGVSDGLFDDCKQKRHASAIVLTRLGDHVVWLADPPREMLGDSEEIIAWARDQRTEVAPCGYRPIMGHNELLDLHRARPELCKQFWMAALGSFNLVAFNVRRIAVLDAVGDKPCLSGHSFDGKWRVGGRFPFVPQASA